MLLSCHSSDVVWELKPKKKNRWKTLSTKEAEMLESSFKEYMDSGPVDNAIVDLENGFQVSLTVMKSNEQTIGCRPAIGDLVSSSPR